MSAPMTPRRAERKSLKLSATCRTASGLRDNGQISDISISGCCITMRGMMVKPGMRVVIRPDGLEGLSGIVRWVRGNQIGVEFDTTLYEPIVEHLCRIHDAGERVSFTAR